MGNNGICVVNNTEFTIDCYLSMGAPHYWCRGLASHEAFVIYPGAVWYTVGAQIAKVQPGEETGAVIDLSVDANGVPEAERYGGKLVLDSIEKSECWLKGVYGGRKGGFFVEARVVLAPDRQSFRFQLVETTAANVIKTIKKSPLCWRKRSTSDKKEYWTEEDGKYYPPKAWKLPQSSLI